MNRAAVILAVVSALCLGSALGFMGGVMFSRYQLHEGRGDFGDRARRVMRRVVRDEHGVPSARVLVPRLQRLLGLTPAQATAIRGEIERTRGSFAQVRDSLHARIERHLTPEQREQWRTSVRDRIPGRTRGRGPRHLREEPGREGDATR